VKFGALADKPCLQAVIVLCEPSRKRQNAKTRGPCATPQAVSKHGMMPTTCTPLPFHQKQRTEQHFNEKFPE